MATTSALLTVEEYLKTVYRPDCDFVDGELEERNVGEHDHGYMQILIGAWFLSHQKAWNTHPVSEQRIRVSRRRVRIPDICITPADAPREQVAVTPPMLCIEILSPEDRLSRTTKVMGDFAAMGVPNLWIIDPYQRIGYVYTSPDTLKLVTERLTIPGTPIYLDLPTLFAELD
jgi:Uma2 family endonuclease